MNRLEFSKVMAGLLDQRCLVTVADFLCVRTDRTAL